MTEWVDSDEDTFAKIFDKLSNEIVPMAKAILPEPTYIQELYLFNELESLNERIEILMHKNYA